MSNDIVLSASMRTNLLSLQGTQNNIDTVQRALSTGLKVNSALDNPQSFFAAKSLNNRASDLGRLLDSMGQSLSTIQTADKGIKSLTSLVEQADSIASQARDAISSGGTTAKIAGDANLTDVTNLVGLNGITTSDTINISISDPDDPDSDAVSGTITISGTMSAEELVASINDLNSSLTEDVISAKTNDAGQLEITALNGGDLNIDFQANTDSDANNLSLASALGFGDQAQVVADGAGGTNVEFTQSASALLNSFSLYQSGSNDLARASDSLEGLTDATGNALISGLDNADDELLISINGGTQATIELSGLTVQGLVDQINSNSTLNESIEASFNSETGQISIQAISAETQSVEFEFEADNGADVLDLGFGSYERTTFTAGNVAGRGESIRFGAAAGELATLEQDYNTVLTQIDELVGDSSYRGTNLLTGDDLSTVFNEDGTSSLNRPGFTGEFLVQ